MRIKSDDDLRKLGPSAKKQVQKILDEQGGFRRTQGQANIRDVAPAKKKYSSPSANAKPSAKKKSKPARVMRTAEDLTYCPWPSPDPFVQLHQVLSRDFGIYAKGGRLVTEMIIEGSEIQWRYDFVILSCHESTLNDDNEWQGQPHIVIESDGYGPHKSLEAFKDDRRKQTHALCQGFLVMRVTREDVVERLDDIISSVHRMTSLQHCHPGRFKVTPKGNTQAVFRWNV